MNYNIKKTTNANEKPGRDLKVFEIVLDGDPYPEIAERFKLDPSRIRQITKKVALDVQRHVRSNDKTIPMQYTFEREKLLKEKDLWLKRLKEYQSSLSLE